MTRAARWEWADVVRARVQDGTLTTPAGHVALALVVHYMNGHLEAWPSQSTLTSTTGLSESTIRRAIQELEHNRLLTVRRGGRHKPGNTYRIRFP